MEDVILRTRAWFKRVWNDGDESAIREMMHPNAVFHGLGLEGSGPDSFIPFHRAFIQGFDNTNVEILELLAKDDSVMGHGVFTGIHHMSKTPVTIEFSFSARWENGQIVEAKNVVDYLPMLSQLQLYSQDILGQALQPKKSQ